jgi:molybdopterin converting factor small subunit
VAVVEITVKFLAGIREDMGTPGTKLSMPHNAVLPDLEPHLRALGIDPEAQDIIITLNGRGLRQWPPDRPFREGDVVAVFPLISGGSG